MEGSVFENPNLTVALALTVGILGQSLANHLRVPGIVVLLATGVLMGPDVLGIIHPETLGEALTALVGFAVAVILFEGGMNLDVARIRRSGKPIQRLLTVGALVTMLGATLAVRAIMQWDWGISALFGTLVVVTGPTVINPLLKRLKVEKGVATILEAEGVLIDPIGAIIAIVALDFLLQPSTGNLLLAAPGVVLRLGVGSMLGMAAGAVLSRALQVHGLVPEGLTNVFTLASVFAIYQGAEAIQHESGIAAVTAAGIMVRYLGTPVERELLEFKEQLTVMLIGMLFVLLAADVRMVEVYSLGVPGALTVAALVFVVRPLNVLVSTIGTDLTTKQRLFLAWMAPRGIVAAAVASLFALELGHKGIAGGAELRALVFLVIAVTVVFAGSTGGLVAWALDLRRPRDQGWVILGAHALARELGKALLAGGEEVLLIDVNAENAMRAEQQGLRVIHGNAMKETTLGRAELDTRAGAIGLTRNEEVNFLFVQKAKQLGRLKRLYVSLTDEATGLTKEMVHKANARVLFGGDHDVERWAAKLEHGTAGTMRVRYLGVEGKEPPAATQIRCDDEALPIVMMRGGVWAPVGDHVTFKRKDVVVLVYTLVHEDKVRAALSARGFESVDDVRDAVTDEAKEAG